MNTENRKKILSDYYDKHLKKKQADLNGIEVKVDFWTARTTLNYLTYQSKISDKLISNTTLIKNLDCAIIVKGVK